MLLKMKSGRYLVPVECEVNGPYMYLSFPFNRALMTEIKMMKGAHWCGYDEPPRKVWRIDVCHRNVFQIEYLTGSNPYVTYDKPLEPFTPRRKIMSHQIAMAAHMLTRRGCIIAGEMGVGKTLAAIEAMEAAMAVDHTELDAAWYVGPKAGVRAVARELIKWGSSVYPTMLTYEGLVKVMTKGIEDYEIPKVVIFDESAKLKTDTAQRTRAAQMLADAVRKQWGEKGLVVEMTGTPNPKSPIDWWAQAEIACPGFLKEGSVPAFRKTLAIMSQETCGISGATYPKLVAWRDREGICDVCGKPADDEIHGVEQTLDGSVSGRHNYIPATNEVQRLYKRLQGLVMVLFKKDCLDLPEKTYELIRIKPTPDMIRAARLITKTAPRAVTALTMLRELSDGIQYTQVEDGHQTCNVCNGRCTIDMHELRDAVPSTAGDVAPEQYVPTVGQCPKCGGTGKVIKYRDETMLCPTPKDEILDEQLDEHDEIGRLIVWAGFSGTIDKIVEKCKSRDWNVLRVDGRGLHGYMPDGHQIDSEELLEAMDSSSPNRAALGSKYPKLVFVGHPGAGGMAYTLTASPTELFYSNDFNAGSRIQAEERFHRAGMDTTRGAKIIDIICLPTDELVLENLRKKRELQLMTLTDVSAALDSDTERLV